MKKSLLIIKTRHPKLRILVPFYVWEDARFWAYWNHSFDVHLSYLGPIRCFSPPWIPSGCTVMSSGCWSDGGQHSLLKWQATFFWVHIINILLPFRSSVPFFVIAGFPFCPVDWGSSSNLSTYCEGLLLHEYHKTCLDEWDEWNREMRVLQNCWEW